MVYRNDFKLIWVIQPLRKKYFGFRRRANQFYQLAPSQPGKEGRIASCHGRGMGCGGRGSAGAQMELQAGFACERRTGAQTNGASPTIPDYALDMHTMKGKAMGRGLDHFRKEKARKPMLGADRTDLQIEEAYRLWAIKQQGKKAPTSYS